MQTAIKSCAMVLAATSTDGSTVRPVLILHFALVHPDANRHQELRRAAAWHKRGRQHGAPQLEPQAVPVVPLQ